MLVSFPSFSLFLSLLSHFLSLLLFFSTRYIFQVFYFFFAPPHFSLVLIYHFVLRTLFLFRVFMLPLILLLLHYFPLSLTPMSFFSSTHFSSPPSHSFSLALFYLSLLIFSLSFVICFLLSLLPTLSLSYSLTDFFPSSTFIFNFPFLLLFPISKLVIFP